MFPIDPAKLPTLRTRQGLMILDPQNDFLAKDGSLAVTHPEKLPKRIADLATAFRQRGGEIIWVRSQFEAPRTTQGEQILTSDEPVLSGASAAGRGRRSRAPQQELDEPSKCPEAFLGPETPARPKCVRADTVGAELHPTVQQSIQPRDYTAVKSHYSAFKSEQLLLHLRKRLITELFICGSLTNIGVMATSVDATRHGLSVAVVKDCCGYRDAVRHDRALQRITDATGCDILTANEVLKVLQPSPKPPQQRPQRTTQKSASAAASGAAGRSSTVRQHAEDEDGDAASLTSALESSLKKLSLNSEPVVRESQHEGRTSTARSSKPQPVVEPSKGEEEKKEAVKKEEEKNREEKEEKKEEDKKTEKEEGGGQEKEETAKGKETERSASDSRVAPSDSPDPEAPPPPADS